MHVESLFAFRYQVPLAAPLNLGPRTIDVREGLLVQIGLDRDAVGWGDVAPLPGFSPESLVDAAEALRELSPEVVSPTVDEALAWTAQAAMPSTVCFGLELALHHAKAAATATTIPYVFGASPARTISYNGLLTGEDALLRGIRSFREAGYRAVKLKVGRGSIDDDITRVKAAHGAAGEVALRLDANRAWTMEQAGRFAAGIDGVPIAYIEEPLRDPSRLPAFAEETGLPVALDETIQEGGRLADHPYAAAAVIKPALVGGITATQQLAQQAASAGVHLVVSSAFESGIGLRGLAALAATVSRADVPMGLDTYRRLQADVVRPRLPLGGPVVDVPELMSTPLHIDPQQVDLERPVIAYRSPL
jgi:O-succinylbenzoate synthase